MGLIIASAYIRWHQIIECPFEWITIEGKPEIIATLSTETLRKVSSQKDIEVTLYSPMFPTKYSDNGISGAITDFTVDSYSSDGYIVHLNIDLPDIIIKNDNEPKIVGILLITIEEDTLLKNLIDNIALL